MVSFQHPPMYQRPVAKVLRHMAADHAQGEYRQQDRHPQVGAQGNQTENPDMSEDQDPTSLVGPVAAVTDFENDEYAPGRENKGVQVKELFQRDLEKSPAKQDADHGDMGRSYGDIQDAAPRWQLLCFSRTCLHVHRHVVPAASCDVFFFSLPIYR